MTVTTTAKFRNELKSCLKKVVDNHDPLTVTGSEAGNVVILSEEDYSAIQETMYLLSTPANAKHLQESINQAEKGDLHEVDL